MRKKLYRYAKRTHNDNLLKFGSLRIGTLYDFRRDDHKAGIADGAEGTKTVYHHIEHHDPSVKTSLPNIDARALSELVPGLFHPDSTGSLTNISVAQQFELPNCYMHCTSYELSSDVMAQFDGAESCIEIHDVRGFYRTLTRAINRVAPFDQYLQRRIIYTSRMEKWNGKNNGIHPGFMKEDSFAPQCEYRVIWTPKSSDPIIPIFITEPLLTKFCRPAEIKKPALSGLSITNNC